jgi:hypothetical protein
MEIKPIFFQEILFFDFLEESAPTVIRPVFRSGRKNRTSRFFLPKVGLISILQNSTDGLSLRRHFPAFCARRLRINPPYGKLGLPGVHRPGYKARALRVRSDGNEST